MDKKVYEVLSKIEFSGYEAYVVGGYVINFLSNKDSFDIDIATSAKTEQLEEMFKEYDYKIKNKCLYFEIAKFTFEITPFRIDQKYFNNRNKFKSKYTNKVQKDSKRRDFSINAIYMNKEEEVLDFHNGLKDLNNKNLRMIGNPNKRLKEDYLRILRAIRFSVTLGFEFDEKLEKIIKKYKHFVSCLSSFRKKEELNKMLNTDILKTIKIIEKYNLYKELMIPYNIKYTKDIYGFWAQTNYSLFPFARKEIKQIETYLDIKK
jgi:tRNA nucleotidyltransferase/poly(A) polymerase